MPDGKLVVLGKGANYEFWMLDLTTGQQNQLTTFRSTDAIESFDISPDGKTIVFDRVRQNADIYTIDLKPPPSRQ
jgi:Tol biopolymer transport system component